MAAIKDPPNEGRRGHREMRRCGEDGENRDPQDIRKEEKRSRCDCGRYFDCETKEEFIDGRGRAETTELGHRGDPCPTQPAVYVATV
jgi:hypothetical protein